MLCDPKVRGKRAKEKKGMGDIRKTETKASSSVKQGVTALVSHHVLMPIGLGFSFSAT